MNAKLLPWFPKALFMSGIVLLVTLFGSQAARAAGVCYVNANVSGGVNNGSSWANAYTDLQSTLGASLCSEVWVAAGTYKPTGGVNRTIKFTLKNGVALYGGFAGIETQRSQRNPATNLTILSGNIGSAGSAADNSYHVVSGGGTDSTAVLDGFTIMAGNANGSTAADYSGGGMDNETGSPTLKNITFTGNSATWGGGIYNNYSSNPTLTNVTFNGNTASYGGGMFNYQSSPTLTNITFASNSVTNRGGGIYNNGSNPALRNVTFSSNSADQGGGMDNETSNPDIRNTILWGNTAVTDGAQMRNANSTPILNESVIQDGCPAWSDCTNIITADPMLSTLGNHGGFTQTISLQTGSSAIDIGNDATCANTDQRGVARPQGVYCDIGAYELVQFTFTISGNAGVAGATLSYIDGFPQATSTDLNGDYILVVTQHWTGMVIPSKQGWSFAPDHKDYANVLSNQTGQDYTANTYRIYLPLVIH